MTRQPGSRIDSYEILETLGQGAFGVTYRVRDTTLDLQFALKEYFPKGLARRQDNGSVIAADGEGETFKHGLKRFVSEGRTLARLDHPNLARVLRHFEGQGTAWLLMPYYEGRTLHELLVRDGTFNPEELAALLKPLLQALSYLEQREVVHGDIKPSNIMISSTGSPVLLDFGAARVLGAAAEDESGSAGSEGFAAPEQYRKTSDIGPATDIYGLAATLYRLLTGQIPVPSVKREDALRAGRSDPLPALQGQKGLEAFDKRFLRAVDQGLSLKPAERPVDATAWSRVFGDLQPAAAKGAQQIKDSVGQAARGDRSERVVLPQILAGIIVTILLAAAVWVFMDDRDVVEDTPQSSQPSSLPDTSLAEDDSSWEQAVRTDSAAGFRAYLEAFPNGRHRAAAREQLAAFDQQRWERLQGSSELADFEDYLEDFPDGRYVVEAQARVDVLRTAQESEARAQAERDARDSAAFSEALSAGTVEALDQYLADFPGGLHVAEAIERKADFERATQDEAAWQSALQRDRLDGYEAYIAAHPQGRFLAQALTAIERLTMKPGKRFRDCPGCPEMIVIPPGRFTQGAAKGSVMTRSNEQPQREVRLSRPFAMSVREVSFREWDQCVAEGSCRAQPQDNGWGRNDRPVILVNWVDAQAYTAWLSEKTGAVYELPSESQWEYVARAGETGPWVGGDAAAVCTHANVAGAETGFDWRLDACSDPFSVGTAPTGYFPANAMGVHDMVGNVAEWTRDCMNLSYLDAPADGSAWERGLCSSRVTRGGSWFSGVQETRLSARFPLRSGERNDFTGLRVVRAVEQ